MSVAEEAQEEIARFRQKYGMGFEEFTASLSGKATIGEEDDWMMWESARDMLETGALKMLRRIQGPGGSGRRETPPG